MMNVVTDFDVTTVGAITISVIALILGILAVAAANNTSKITGSRIKLLADRLDGDFFKNGQALATVRRELLDTIGELHRNFDNVVSGGMSATKSQLAEINENIRDFRSKVQGQFLKSGEVQDSVDRELIEIRDRITAKVDELDAAVKLLQQPNAKLSTKKKK